MNAIEKEKIKEKLAEEIVETKQKIRKYKDKILCKNLVVAVVVHN